MKTRHITAYVGISLVAAIALVSANFAHAQSAASTYSTSGATSVDATSTGITSDTITTPGLPDTGAGGDAAQNLAIVLASGAVLVGGAFLLARRRFS